MKKYFLILTAITCQFLCCADRDDSEEEVNIIFTIPDPKSSNKGQDPGAYPRRYLNMMKYIQLLESAASYEEGFVLPIPLDKQSFDNIIHILKQKSLPKNLTLNDFVSLMKALNFLMIPEIDNNRQLRDSLKITFMDLLTNMQPASAELLIPHVNDLNDIDNYFQNELSKDISSMLKFDLFSLSDLTKNSFYAHARSFTIDLRGSTSCHLSHDGKFVFSLGEKQVQQWDINTGEVINESAISFTNIPFSISRWRMTILKEYIVLADGTSPQMLIINAQDLQSYEFYRLEGSALLKNDPNYYQKAIHLFVLYLGISSPDGKHLILCYRSERSNGYMELYSINIKEKRAYVKNHFEVFNHRDQLAATNNEIYYLSNDEKLVTYDTTLTSEKIIQLPFTMALFNYQLNDILFINDLSQTQSMIKTYTFNTTTHELKYEGLTTYSHPLIISERLCAIAANPNNKLNEYWGLSVPTPEDRSKSHIYLNNPHLIESLQDPTKGTLVYHREKTDFNPIGASHDGSIFAFQSENEVFIFKKSGLLPLPIVFGLYCFEKFDDLGTLREIRNALLPMMRSLPQNIGKLVNDYFIAKTKELAQKKLKV